MNVQQSYDAWSNSYDTMANKTRDLEATALQAMLANIQPTSILELGCGTGKNTQWLMGRTSTLTAVDFSQAMLAKARERISAPHVRFIQADLLQPWHFATAPVGLAICSLVLEHIEHLLPFFEQVAQVLQPGGFFYIGELHPFKQYTGSKAKFDTGKDLVELDSFVHHVSDFTGAAAKAGLQVVSLQEWFDTDDRSSEPRILALLFQKPL